MWEEHGGERNGFLCFSFRQLECRIQRLVARHWTWEPQGGARDGSPIPACIQTSEVKQAPFLQGFSGSSLLLRDPGGAGWGSFQILSLGAPRDVQRGDRSSALHSRRLLTALGVSEKWLSREEATPKEDLSEVQRLMP